MKQAYLIMFESQANDSDIRDRLGKAFSGIAITMRQFKYDPNNPEEVTYHSGKWLRFLANGQGQVEEEPVPDSRKETFLKVVWQAAKPLLKEVWYGPKPEEKQPSKES